MNKILLTLLILTVIAAITLSLLSSKDTKTPAPVDPYAHKTCEQQYMIFMKRNLGQYEEQGQIVRVNTGTLPTEARQILRECRDALGGLDNSRVSILRNFAFQ